MPHLRFRGKNQWYNPCEYPIYVYKYGEWRRVEQGTKFYYNGVWHTLDCGIGIEGEWVEGEVTCEKTTITGEWIQDTIRCEKQIIAEGTWIIDTIRCEKQPILYTGMWVENTTECQKQAL